MTDHTCNAQLLIARKRQELRAVARLGTAAIVVTLGMAAARFENSVAATPSVQSSIGERLDRARELALSPGMHLDREIIDRALNQVAQWNDFPNCGTPERPQRCAPKNDKK